MGAEDVVLDIFIFIWKNSDRINIGWTIPAVRIKDAPRFAYRGMHLDVSRHFFAVDEVKRYLDIMELHKLNKFHWHLTDDQGWRIEIKKYPELTQIGSKRKGTCIRKEWDNLDGGGSSALWTSTTGVISHPRDNRRFDHEGERTVPNLIAVY